MTKCFFITDLHGHESRYYKLFNEIKRVKPAYVFNGGDILPHGIHSTKNFIASYLIPAHEKLKRELKDNYPEFFYIMGNDDPKSMEKFMADGERNGLWKYVHNRVITLNDYYISGYSYVPPTPFLLKDWEKYDVSRYADPGCVKPEEGLFTTKVEMNQVTYSTIMEDLTLLTKDTDNSKLILLAHSPPYRTKLDMIDMRGKLVDNVQPDNHVGSIAIKRFIEKEQPHLTLHGHIHESASLSGSWMEKIGRTVCINGATDTNKLCIIEFELSDPGAAEKRII